MEDTLCCAAPGDPVTVAGASAAAPSAGEHPWPKLACKFEIYTELEPFPILKWSQWSLLMVHGDGDGDGDGEFLEFF